MIQISLEHSTSRQQKDVIILSNLSEVLKKQYPESDGWNYRFSLEYIGNGEVRSLDMTSSKRVLKIANPSYFKELELYDWLIQFPTEERKDFVINGPSPFFSTNFVYSPSPERDQTLALCEEYDLKFNIVGNFIQFKPFSEENWQSEAFLIKCKYPNLEIIYD